MSLNSLIENYAQKEENNKAGCTLTVGGQYTLKTFQIKMHVLQKCYAIWSVFLKSFLLACIYNFIIYIEKGVDINERINDVR